MKEGSFLCHISYCYRYRIAARLATEADSGGCNAGKRVFYDAGRSPESIVMSIANNSNCQAKKAGERQFRAFQPGESAKSECRCAVRN